MFLLDIGHLDIGHIADLSKLEYEEAITVTDPSDHSLQFSEHDMPESSGCWCDPLHSISH